MNPDSFHNGNDDVSSVKFTDIWASWRPMHVLALSNTNPVATSSKLPNAFRFIRIRGRVILANTGGVGLGLGLGLGLFGIPIRRSIR
jgi:hypothetical protein